MSGTDSVKDSLSTSYLLPTKKRKESSGLNSDGKRRRFEEPCGTTVTIGSPIKGMTQEDVVYALFETHHAKTLAFSYLLAYAYSRLANCSVFNKTSEKLPPLEVRLGKATIQQGKAENGSQACHDTRGEICTNWWERLKALVKSGGITPKTEKMLHSLGFKEDLLKYLKEEEDIETLEKYWDEVLTPKVGAYFQQNILDYSKKAMEIYGTTTSLPKAVNQLDSRVESNLRPVIAKLYQQYVFEKKEPELFIEEMRTKLCEFFALGVKDYQTRIDAMTSLMGLHSVCLELEAKYAQNNGWKEEEAKAYIQTIEAIAPLYRGLLEEHLDGAPRINRSKWKYTIAFYSSKVSFVGSKEYQQTKTERGEMAIAKDLKACRKSMKNGYTLNTQAIAEEGKTFTENCKTQKNLLEMAIKANRCFYPEDILKKDEGEKFLAHLYESKENNPLSNIPVPRKPMQSQKQLVFEAEKK